MTDGYGIRRIMGAALGTILGTALCGVLAGCAAVQGEAGRFDGPYAEEYRLTYEQASQDGNEFVMEALADGELTEAEAQEAADRYVQCMAERGYTATKEPTGAGDVYHPDAESDGWRDQLTVDMDDCERASGSLLLAGLWTALSRNPDNIEITDEQRIACLRRYGVVDDSYTDEQILEALSTPGWIALDAADPAYDKTRADNYITCTTNPVSP